MRALLVAVLAFALVGCVTYSEVTNDSNDSDRAGSIDNRVNSIDASLPEMPVPVEGEPDAAYRLRLETWERMGNAVLATLRELELPPIGSVDMSGAQIWKDQRGTGGAETRARGEASADAAVGVGGSNVTKDGGSTESESNTENRDTSTDLGDSDDE